VREKNKIAIVGCGNLLLKDDGVGIYVLDELKKLKLPKNIKLIDAGVNVVQILSELNKFEKIIIVDAVKANKVGKLYRLKADKLRNLKSNLISTHNITLLHAFELLKILNKKSLNKIIIYGIGVRNIGFGKGLSKELKKIMPKIVKKILEEIFKQTSLQESAKHKKCKGRKL
jgi:hydrogenase maturation protease